MKRVLVCGDRNWCDFDLLCNAMDILGPVEVVTGGARGADALGEAWAQARGYACRVYAAEWDRYGRRAGPLRNARMLREGQPDLVVAFHDDLESSKGTKDMVRRAKRAGVPVVVVAHADTGSDSTIISMSQTKEILMRDEPGNEQQEEEAPDSRAIAEEQADAAADAQAESGGTQHPEEEDGEDEDDDDEEES